MRVTVSRDVPIICAISSWVNASLRRGSALADSPFCALQSSSSFTLSNPGSKRAIKDYVESQAHDEKVLHAEKVKSEHVVGRDYDCWDVHTDKDRYWVITSPSNLYSQSYFPSLDYTLSFHIGVTARIMALQRGAPNPSHKSRFTPAWRRWEEAAESYDTAEEAEDFQAVGMKCRESLIQFVSALAKPTMVRDGKGAPKRADVVGSELIASTIAGGGGNEYIRGHLKAMAKSAWQLAETCLPISSSAVSLPRRCASVLTRSYDDVLEVRPVPPAEPWVDDHGLRVGN